MGLDISYPNLEAKKSGKRARLGYPAVAKVLRTRWNHPGSKAASRGPDLGALIPPESDPCVDVAVGTLKPVADSNQRGFHSESRSENSRVDLGDLGASGQFPELGRSKHPVKKHVRIWGPKP